MFGIVHSRPKANEREQYRESIPAYVYDTIQQHNGKPHWFQYLTGAKNVRVPLLQASSLFYQSLLGSQEYIEVIYRCKS